jgi:D-glycero-alpha-D-manno-heptose-7-phosphate kinase
VIVSSAPLRISLVGGGSDLPSFTDHSIGRVVSASIDKRVYITLSHSFSDMYRISYSKLEIVDSIESINHILVKSCLKKVDWRGPALEITSIADVPSSGTGLGSSSAFTVALLFGLYAMQGKKVASHEIALQACEVEIDMAGSPIGRQDQFASAIGGLNEFTFHKEIVDVERISSRVTKRNEHILRKLNDNLLFYHLEAPRNANRILETQSNLITQDVTSQSLTAHLAELATLAKKALIRGDLTQLGNLMTLGWEIKSKLNGDFENLDLVEMIDFVRQPNVLGGKLLGAGASGFFAILAKPENHGYVHATMAQRFKAFPIKLVNSGPRVQQMGR